MDITETHIFRKELLSYTKKLKLDKNKILLLGSASLKALQYFSDYDLFCRVTKSNTNEEPTNIKNKIEHILVHSMIGDDIYFIEMKIQYLNGDKNKINTLDNLKNLFVKDYTNIDFIKLDYVVRIENRFYELSIIYKFDNNKPTNANLIKSIQEDIDELIKEGQHFKILKREFSIFKLEKRKTQMVKLSRFFNSNIGKLYSETSNLKTIQLLLEHYHDKVTLKKVQVNLKDLHMKSRISDISNVIKENELIINREAKLFTL